MTVRIELEQRTFERLQALAEPFVDTPDSIIRRLLDRWESTEGTGGERDPATGDEDVPDVIELDPLNLPDMRFTRLTRAIVNGSNIPRPNWNGVLQHVFELVFEAAGRDLDEAVRIFPVNAVRGRKSDKGYRPLDGLGVSVRSVSASDVASLLMSAFASDCPALRSMTLALGWLPKPEAAHPDRHGRLTV